MKPFAFLPLLASFFSITTFAQVAFWQTPPVQEVIKDETPVLLGGKATSPLVLSEQGLNEVSSKARIKMITYRMPKDFDYEFSLLVVDGKIERAFVVSTSIEGKVPVLGIHRISVHDKNGNPFTLKSKPFAWRRSMKYENSPMFWAINISGGYFLHSSPHYGNLGRPASMGCIRASIPDAMQVFDTLANRFPGVPAYSIIYEKTNLADTDARGTQLLLQTLMDSGWSIDQLKQALAQSRKEVEAVSRGDLQFKANTPVDAHARPFSGSDKQDESIFPTCGGVNCWDHFKHPRAILTLKSHLLTGAQPKLIEYTLHQPLHIKAPQRLNLNEIFEQKIAGLDAKNLYSVVITMSSKLGSIQVRVCDASIAKCSKPRGPESGARTESEYPMFQIADQLNSNKDLILKVESGEGTIEALTIKYYQ